MANVLRLHLDLAGTNQVEQALSVVCNPRDVIQFKKTGTAFHGMEQAKNGVHGLATTIY